MISLRPCAVSKLEESEFARVGISRPVIRLMPRMNCTKERALRRQLKRHYVVTFFQKPTPCLVDIEGCASCIIGRANHHVA